MKALLPVTAAVPVFAPLVGKKIGLIHSPATGNSGDRLIELAAEQLLTRFGISFSVVEPDSPGDADALLLFGGGNYGHENCKVEADRRRLALATGKPCVLLPQTAYGPEPRADYHAAYARDATSQGFIPDSVLAPDLVMCWTPTVPLPTPEYRLGEFFSRLAEGLHSARGIDPRYRYRDPLHYFTFVARHEKIVTDSLHCAIIGLVAGRRVTLCPTRLHKQRSTWETWLRWLGCEWADRP